MFVTLAEYNNGAELVFSLPTFITNSVATEDNVNEGVSLTEMRV